MGQNCSLICTVSGAVERSTITYRWMKNNGSAQIQIGDGSNVLSFSYLKLSDAGQYTCQVMVDTSMFGYSEYITVQSELKLCLSSYTLIVILCMHASWLLQFHLQ